MYINWTKQAAQAKRERTNNMLMEAHNRASAAARERNRAPRRRTGVVGLSNTDTLRRAMEIRRRLMAKLQEVGGSDAEGRTRDTMLATVKMQLARVDQQIAAIRRRERAVEEERQARRDECPCVRRRRRHDLRPQSINIRRDFLYSAEQGGFNPNNPLGFNGVGEAAVAMDMGGQAALLGDNGMDAAALELSL